jgi:hypothetical protein
MRLQVPIPRHRRSIPARQPAGSSSRRRRVGRRGRLSPIRNSSRPGTRTTRKVPSDQPVSRRLNRDRRRPPTREPHLAQPLALAGMSHRLARPSRLVKTTLLHLAEPATLRRDRPVGHPPNRLEYPKTDCTISAATPLRPPTPPPNHAHRRFAQEGLAVAPGQRLEE